MDKGTQFELTLQRMSQGGYLVFPGYVRDNFNTPIFASTTIDEALTFMRDMIKPIGPEQATAKQEP